MLVLGIMSGTSIDGIDYALCDVSTNSVRLVRHWTAGFPSKMRTRLHAAASNDCLAHEVAQLHHDLGRLYAKHAVKFLSSCPARSGKLMPRLAGLHGQTIFHHPSATDPATLQIGEPAYLAEALHVPVISNFRAADLAAGGEGAPLAPLFHSIVFAHKGRHVCVNNIGGISNVTSLDGRSGRKPLVRAFDTGPGNVLLDLAMRHFSGGAVHHDVGGRCAARGTVNHALVGKWLRHPYFRRTPPKSTGRELFGEPFFKRVLADCGPAAMQPADIVATLTEFTARSIALAYQLHLAPVHEVVLCGGGVRNEALVRCLKRAFGADVTILSSEDFGWPSQAIEAAAFAVLAYFSHRCLSANIATGARRRCVLGQISKP